ncbi:hypothetical protein [Sphingomonas sp. Leaf357]|uniref:hypothetical protein n=1 Tax=Sphingomonas sp. Leaf357 TaxID=1736350 RepID=UPI0012E1101E|nr:hypothetical protein [Sphingomonas sp. Leaf357]
MLVAILCFALGLDQLLLWLFLGLVPLWGLPVIALMAAPAFLLARHAGIDAEYRPGAKTVLVCGSVAAIIFLLGGEGRLFYAHTDWQVRAAVLRDLTIYPWPFVYDVRSTPDLLRAPLGMYLAPALIGKESGYHAAEWALFVQNSALLAVLFLLGSHLFEDARSRKIALAIFLGFSGMDIVGQLMAGQSLLATSERWNVAIFTAHLTQAFAVPQHGLAGWVGALLFLLWRTGKISLAAFLAPIPLLALWSPFAVMGIAPFAAFGAIAALMRGQVRPRDIGPPALTLALSTPSLLYLASGSGAVGGGSAAIDLSQYLIFELIEVGPYLVGLWFIGRHGRFGGTTIAVTAIVLLVAPFIQVGTSNDFVMRASIPALAILSLSVADVLVKPAVPGRELWRNIMIGALLLGAATPAFDVVRAVIYPRAPEVVCSYFGVVPGGFDTYVTPWSHANRLIAPQTPAKIKPYDPARCWTGKWPNPLYRDFPERVAPEDWDDRI